MFSLHRFATTSILVGSEFPVDLLIVWLSSTGGDD